MAPKPLLAVPEFQPLLLIPSALIETDSAVISEHESLQLNVFNDIFEKILSKASVCIFKLKPAKYSDCYSKLYSLSLVNERKNRHILCSSVFIFSLMVLVHLIIHKYNNTAILNLAN